MTTSVIDLSSRISQLQAETAKLADQLAECENRAQTELEGRQHAEERIRQLESELTSTRIERDELRQGKKHLSSINRRLTKKMDQRNREVKRALSALYML